MPASNTRSKFKSTTREGGTVPGSLIRGRYVVSSVSLSDTRIIEHGAVYEVDGTISEVGSFDILRSKYPEAEMIGSESEIVLPGFINAHHHVGLTPFQLGSPDLPLELWIISRLGARAVDPYLDTLFSAFELVSSGVTTVQHIQSRMFGPHDRWISGIEDILRAYRDIGLRVSFSFNLRDQSRLIYGDDYSFAEGLPSELRNDAEGFLRDQAMPLSDQLDLFFVDLGHRWNGERVRVQLAPANYHWLSDRGLEEIKSYADRFRVPMHMHVLETPYQRAYARRRSGGSVVRRLNDMDFLDARLTLGHAVWITEKDLDLLVSSGSLVCHNASSNLRLRSGLAPVPDLVRRGVPVAIGLDEAGINDDRDMLQEMRLVLGVHCIPGIERHGLTADQVLSMATMVGALTTAFGDMVGLLEPGRAADMTLVDWSDITYPFLDEDVPLVDALIRCTRPPHIKRVIVGGETIYQNGVFTRVDRAQILQTLAASLAAAPSDNERRRRKMARELLPYVERYYRGWLDGDSWGPPYAMSNSRL